MSFSANDAMPFTQARANLSELAEQAKAGAEKIITNFVVQTRHDHMSDGYAT